MSLYGGGGSYGGGLSTNRVGGTFYSTQISGYQDGSPVNLTAYQNVDGSVVLYWGYDPCAPRFSSFVWSIQTDTDPSFASPNLLSYTSAANPNFIQGYTHAGISVPTYPRAQGQTTTMYWRVSGTISSATSKYAQSTFVIPGAINISVAQAMLGTLPDVIYKKDFSQGTSNLYKIYLSIGKELDTLNMDLTLVGNDAYAVSVRDQSLQSNFGDLMKVQRPNGMKSIDYREILRTIMANANMSPSVASIKALIASMFCAEPTITLIRNDISMFVNDIASSPPVPWFNVTDSAYPQIVPGTIWGNPQLAFGTIISINNPLNVPIPLSFVEGLVNKFAPAFAPIFITGIL